MAYFSWLWGIILLGLCYEMLIQICGSVVLKLLKILSWRLDEPKLIISWFLLKTLLCWYYYYVVDSLKSCMPCTFICIKSELCSHHVGLDWQILSWKLKAYALMPTKMAMILSWEFYSEWYHMHDESSLIRVAFCWFVVCVSVVLILSMYMSCVDIGWLMS